MEDEEKKFKMKKPLRKNKQKKNTQKKLFWMKYRGNHSEKTSRGRTLRKSYFELSTTTQKKQTEEEKTKQTEKEHSEKDTLNEVQGRTLRQNKQSKETIHTK